jgi:hypothetical protein
VNIRVADVIDAVSTKGQNKSQPYAENVNTIGSQFLLEQQFMMRVRQRHQLSNGTYLAYSMIFTNARGHHSLRGSSVCVSY